MVRVLLVEDEPRMREMITLYLTAKEMVVTEASNGEQAWKALEKDTFDIILLDLMMPVMDGYTFLNQLETETPILVLTAKDRVEDKLLGFELGIDDYMTKPFDLREMVARIQVLVRRSRRGYGVADRSEWNMDTKARRLWVHAHEILLTPKEFHILEILSKWPSKVFTREELLEQIWNYDFDGDVRVVDTHVKNIREKCKRAGLSFPPIVTVWGIGYRYGGPEKV